MHRAWLLPFLGIHQSPTAANRIHQLHEEHASVKGHGLTFGLSFPDAAHRLRKLVLIAADLGRDLVLLHHLVLEVIDGDALRIIDVFHHDVALVAVDDTLAVGTGVDTVGQHRHPSVAVEEGDGLHTVHTGIGHLHGGLHTFKVLAEVHQSKVQSVHTDVQQRAACQLRFPNPAYSSDHIGEICRKGVHLADDAAFDHPVNDGTGGHIPGPYCLRCKESLLPRKLRHPLCLRRVHGESLLTDNGFSPFQTHHHVLVVVGVGRGHVDKFHLRIAKEFLVASVGFLKSVLRRKILRPLQGAGCHGIALDLLHCRKGGRSCFSNAAHTDDTKFHSSLILSIVIYFEL